MRGRRFMEAGAHRGPGPFGRFGGPGWGGPRGRRRRGDVRLAVLHVLSDNPAHGYEIITTLEERSGGTWRPSPGSVYPMLQMLEDEGLVRGEDRDGKRVFSITDAGRRELEERADEVSAALGDGADADHRVLMHAMGQCMAAARQVLHTGDATTVQRAAEIFDDARKRLYQLLAEA